VGFPKAMGLNIHGILRGLWQNVHHGLVEVFFLQFVEYVVNQFLVSFQVFLVAFGWFELGVNSNVINIQWAQKPLQCLGLLENLRCSA
jgi:hypothetical protein